MVKACLSFLGSTISQQTSWWPLGQIFSCLSPDRLASCSPEGFQPRSRLHIILQAGLPPQITGRGIQPSPPHLHRGAPSWIMFVLSCFHNWFLETTHRVWEASAGVESLKSNCCNLKRAQCDDIAMRAVFLEGSKHFLKVCSKPS